MSYDYSNALDDLFNDHQNRNKKGNGGSNFIDNIVTMPQSDGVVTVRILPPKAGGKLCCSTRLHKINGKNYHCLCTYINDRWVGNCPACAWNRALWKKADAATSKEEKEALIAEASSIKPTKRYYYAVVVRSQKGTFKDGKMNKLNIPLIWPIGIQIQAKITDAVHGNEELSIPKKGIVFHPDDGYDFNIIKVTKAGDKFPNYDKSYFAEQKSPLGTPEQISEWLENLPDLQALRVLKPIEEVQEQIDIHRGLKPNPDTEFDPTTFNAARPSTLVIDTTTKAVNKSESKPKSEDDYELSEEDKAMLENDFFKNMGNGN